MTATPRCDFCNAPNSIKFRFPATNFVIRGESINSETLATKKVDYESVADWAGCEECGALVIANQWDELLERSVRSFIAANPGSETKPGEAFLYEGIGELHKGFREHWTGETIEVET